MRSLLILVVSAAFSPILLWAGEPQPNKEYAEFSRLIHAIAVKQLPKEIEDKSHWGQMTEIPGDLPLMALRKTVKAGDKLQAPHGAWLRGKGKVENPDKNLKIVVKDFKKLNATTYRVVADADITLVCQGQWQQWQKGLLLVSADVTADANLTAAVVCDVSVSLNFKKVPPELVLEPKVTELGLNLVDFKMRDPIFKGAKGDALRNELKEILRSIVKTSELMVKDQANQAIVEAIRAGKGNISADAIMKSLPMPK